MNDEVLLGPLGAGRTVARLARQVELALAGLELSLAQFRILALLAAGAEVSSSLAANLAVSAPSITTVVDGLVARHLVDRRHGGGEDRRRVAVTLTPAGAEILERAEVAVAARLGSIVALLGDDELVRQAEKGLELWREALLRHRAEVADRRPATPAYSPERPVEAPPAPT